MRSEKKVKAVSSLLEVDVQYTSERGTVLLSVPVLDLYDSILVEYA